MNVPRLNDKVTQAAALEALREYRANRAVYDDRDWEIEKIYRQISKGKIVISVSAAIAAAGVSELGQPRLAITRADAPSVRYQVIRGGEEVRFDSLAGARWEIRAACPGVSHNRWDIPDSAETPRIPPQHRPAAKHLRDYWILFEAEWATISKDPLLLKRIGKDAWIVLAAWDLTDVELSVLRAHT